MICKSSIWLPAGVCPNVWSAERALHRSWKKTLWCTYSTVSHMPFQYITATRLGYEPRRKRWFCRSFSMRKWTMCSLMRQSPTVQKQTCSDSAVTVECRWISFTCKESTALYFYVNLVRHVSIVLWWTIKFLWFTLQDLPKSLSKACPCMHALSVYVSQSCLWHKWIYF